MENKSIAVQSALTKILHTLQLPPLDSFGGSGNGDAVALSANHVPPTQPECDQQPGVRFLLELSSPDNPSEPRRQSQTAAAGMAMTRENSQEVESNESSHGLVSAPMGTLFEVTKLRNLRSNPQEVTHRSTTDDLISSGQIKPEQAEMLFRYFDRSLNHYLWGGLALVHDNLASLRASSSLLLTAILTVTALHIPGMESVFDVCYAEFVSLVCESMLDRYHTLDGIRGLCIGAFWLSDLSWKLSGHAVRIATELGLHQSYAKVIKGSSEHFQGARLWYLLYVCDHHFSIAYNRPPVIHEDATIIDHERFLRLPGIGQADLRLHSQIAIFVILTRMYHTFGPDIEQRLTDGDLNRVRRFNLDLDTWRVNWEPKLASSPHVSAYPAKGVGLHYHYAKFQLNSLSLRGCQPSPSFELSTERREFANTAISCAETILRMVLDEPDIRNALVGVPLYLHTMITYATVFLLKVRRKWKTTQLGTDLALIQDLLTRVIVLLRDAKASERHLTYHIAAGLTKMLDRFVAWEHHDLSTGAGTVQADQSGPSQQYQPVPPASRYGIDPEYGQMAMYGDPMQLYGENYFPFGFFDVLSSALPE
ncbi:hypothetical protein B0A49_00559 [Cryomyces minteri]|uniref:Xylanolytic transcriptional activator regulatory domain-containing protein n=1 Tax=Cryomyces minteri TaxID=331657 RepID=A0A4U0XXC4_9PEZI|nr:hypothetical protein B0A49_00559 [Cryomyces minteri]